MTALPVNNWKYRVKSVRSQYNLTRWVISPHSILRNGVNGSFAPIGWPRKGGRNSDSTTQAKESPICFLSGEQTPVTGVNKCSNPDEGTSNEVSSLANEKFISSRNKYGLKESSTCWRWCVFTSHWKPNTTFRCVGLHIKWMSWSLRIINWPVEESTVEKSTLNNLRVKQRLDIGISGS